MFKKVNGVILSVYLKLHEIFISLFVYIYILVFK